MPPKRASSRPARSAKLTAKAQQALDDATAASAPPAEKRGRGRPKKEKPPPPYAVTEPVAQPPVVTAHQEKGGEEGASTEGSTGKAKSLPPKPKCKVSNQICSFSLSYALLIST